MRDTDKFRGSLIGGAAGDALGYEVEFWSEEKIPHRELPNKPRSFSPPSFGLTD